MGARCRQSSRWDRRVDVCRCWQLGEFASDFVTLDCCGSKSLLSPQTAPPKDMCWGGSGGSWHLEDDTEAVI